jgi:hypothetical protein
VVLASVDCSSDDDGEGVVDDRSYGLGLISTSPVDLVDLVVFEARGMMFGSNGLVDSGKIDRKSQLVSPFLCAGAQSSSSIHVDGPAYRLVDLTTSLTTTRLGSGRWLGLNPKDMSGLYLNNGPKACRRGTRDGIRFGPPSRWLTISEFGSFSISTYLVIGHPDDLDKPISPSV